MGMQFPSAYEQVMDKAKALSQRTFMLANLVCGSPADLGAFLDDSRPISWMHVRHPPVWSTV